MLTSEGHNDSDLLTYSLDKLRLYYDNTIQRRSKQAAATQLSMMHAFLSSLAAMEGNFKMYNENEATLRGVLFGTNDEKPDQAVGLAIVQKRLIASGARIAHAPIPHSTLPK